MRFKLFTALIATAALAPAYAHAEGFSYSYVEGGYVNTDIDDLDEDVDGFALKGSFELTPHLFVFGNYANQGTSIFGTAWDSRTQHHRVHLVEGASREGWALEGAFYDSLRAAGMTLEQIRGQLERLIEVQAQTLGANDIFLVSSVLYLTLIVPVLLARPVRARRRVPAPAPSTPAVGPDRALDARPRPAP